MLLISYEIIRNNQMRILFTILKTVVSLTTEQLENRLRDLIKANKLENKPHIGRNSYFIVENEGSTFLKETSPHQILFFLKKHPSRYPS